MLVAPRKIKVTLFGGRHTGQGPISRAWGQTDADVPALQPVVIYDREITLNHEPVIVAAWVLSLDPEFDYMRRAMYERSDAFIYTFDILSQPEKSLKYLSPFVAEARETLGRVPPEALVGTMLDPTLARPTYVDTVVELWIAEHGEMPYFEVNITDSTTFPGKVEEIFEKIVSQI